MSEALAAIEAGQWDAARSALDRAAALRPDAPEVADARSRLDAGERREKLTRTLERAAALEAREAWREAENAYASVLEIDPTNARARTGADRAASRADLDEAIEYHIRHPGRLAEDAVLEEARALLAAATEAVPRGPGLTDQMSRLQEVIRIASTPIPVVLESDGLTEVTVYRVGRLGRFSRRELSLRPGTYTVVGSRDGFRDVRLRMQVPAADDGPPLFVACREAL